MDVTEKSTAMRDIDAPHYRYWQALYHSFFNNKLYVDVGKRWKGLSLLYLLLLMFIVTIPVAVHVMRSFNYYYYEQLLMPLKRLPPVYIQNGQVYLNEPMPYLVKNDEGQVVAIVDTTGTVTSMDKKYPQLAVLITRDKLIYRTPSPPQLFRTVTAPSAPINEQIFDKDMNQVFEGPLWVNSTMVKVLMILVDVLIYPTIAVLFLVIYLILLFVFSLMAQLAAKVLLKMDLTYGQAFRLLMVSTTPQITVLMLTVYWIFPGRSFVLIGLTLAYFVFAVLSLKRESHRLVLR